jgi:dTDP-4-dehydrorhamnose 3,5-epimerase
MKFIETGLKGAFVIEPEPIEDERGKFARVFCKNEFSTIGHQKEFVQLNHSINKIKGTVRGLHFQKSPHQEIKLIRCIRGIVFDVMIDLRAGSATYLKWFSEIITAENMKMMYIPEGFAHGFQTLEADSELLYHHTGFYTPSAEAGINALDKTIHISWPEKITLMSDRDQSLPSIDINFNAF